MISRFLCILVLILWLSSGTGVFAQTGNLKLTGTVLHAETRKPLENITVLKTSTRRGTISKANGQFIIMVQPGDTLLIRAVGFIPLHYVVHARAQADLAVEILLEEGSQVLPEVKVVGGLDYEKVNRALRNQKRPPAPKVAARPPAPKPLFPEKETKPVAPSIENPASLLYDLLSKEGKDRRRLEEMLAEEARLKKEIEDKKKQRAYDSLFLDRNKDFKRP